MGVPADRPGMWTVNASDPTRLRLVRFQQDFVGLVSGFLERHVENETNDAAKEDQAGENSAETQAAIFDWLRQEIAEGGAKRPRQDVGEPEGQDAVEMEQVPGKRDERYDATEQQAFLSGQVDIFSTAEMLVSQVDKKNPARQVEVKFVLDNFKLAVGVKKDETRLLEEVNKWIDAKLKDGTLNAIYRKQFGTDLPDLILKQ